MGQGQDNVALWLQGPFAEARSRPVDDGRYRDVVRTRHPTIRDLRVCNGTIELDLPHQPHYG